MTELKPNEASRRYFYLRHEIPMLDRATALTAAAVAKGAALENDHERD